MYGVHVHACRVGCALSFNKNVLKQQETHDLKRSQVWHFFAGKGCVSGTEPEIKLSHAEPTLKTAKARRDEKVADKTKIKIVKSLKNDFSCFCIKAPPSRSSLSKTPV